MRLEHLLGISLQRLRPSLLLLVHFSVPLRGLTLKDGCNELIALLDDLDPLLEPLLQLLL